MMVAGILAFRCRTILGGIRRSGCFSRRLLVGCFLLGSGRTVDWRSRFWLIPVLLFFWAGVCQILPLLVGQDAVVVDGAGVSWRAHDLRESAVIVMMATMLGTSVLALLRWFEGLRRGEGA